MKNGVCPRLVASLTLSNKLRLFDLVQLHPTFSSKQAKKPYNNTKSSQLVMASNGEMSHAEMWDDSALVDSWNDAVEEYKKYHSIKARGENEDEVLSAVEGKSSGLAEITVVKGGEYDENTVDDQHAKANTSGKTADHDTIASQKLTQSNNMRSGPAQAVGGPPALPQHLIGQVHDEGLKNLLMSWYYAGYYTGLYEGQQQERAGSSAKHEA